MKILVLISLVVLVAQNSFAKENSDLVGTWELSGLVCETANGTAAYPNNNPFLNTTIKPKKTFKSGGVYQDQITIPIGKDTTCETLGEGTFNIVDNKLLVQMVGVDSPDCPGFVTGFNEDLKTNGLFINEFKLNGSDELLLYQPLKAGETDFSCGKEYRVIELWKKLVQFDI